MGRKKAGGFFGIAAAPVTRPTGAASICYFERGAVFGPRLAVIVDARRGDVRMAAALRRELQGRALSRAGSRIKTRLDMADDLDLRDGVGRDE